MRHILFAAIAMFAMATMGSAYAQFPRSSSDYTAPTSAAAALDALRADWERAGFQPPSKPAQFRVYGRDGYATSGPGYNAMVTLIRSAAADVRAGRDQDALVKVGKARNLLTHSSKRVMQ